MVDEMKLKNDDVTSMLAGDIVWISSNSTDFDSIEDKVVPIKKTHSVKIANKKKKMRIKFEQKRWN